MTEIIITSSVLILVIAAVRWLLRGEFPLRLQYALWALAAVRLLVPVSFVGSAFSVLNAAPAVELPDRGNIYVSDQGITAQQPPPQIGWEAAGSSVGADGERIPGESYAFYYAPDSNDWTLFPVDETPPEGFTTVPASRILPTPKAALTAIWYVGMAAMGGWFLWVNLSFRKKLRAAARKVEQPDCPLPVYVAEGLPSPCLFGLLRPAIYVTPACLEEEDRLRHVLAHELTHARHGDPFWSLVRCVCLTVYWFDPLVWLAAALSRRDCELACDEGTLAKLGEEERTAYGRTLIGLMAQSASPSYLLHTATTMVDRKRGIKERLLLIAKKPMTLAVTTAAVLLIAGIAVACTFTGAAETSDGYAAVEEALADLPEEFRPTDSIAEGIAVFTPEARPNGIPDSLVEAALEEGELFRAYSKFHIAISSNLEDPLGWMASVYRMDQSGYDGLVEAEGMMGRRANSYWECFAKDSEFYYLIYAPLTAPEPKPGGTEGAELQGKLVAWIKEAVLNVQDVTAFDGERIEYAPQGGPLDLPAGPTGGDDPPAAAFTGTAEEAFRLLLSGDNSLLDDGRNARAWLDFNSYDWAQDWNLDYFLLDVDNDGVPELVMQHPDSPAILNGVFDYRDGAITCWRFDNMDSAEFQYALMDGTMVFEFHFGDMVSYDIFRYTPDGERKDLNSLFYRPDNYLGSGEPASWEVDYEPVTEEEFNRALAERITSRRLTAGVQPNSPAGPAAAFTGTAEEAFRRLLNGDTSLLANGPHENAWRDWLDSPKDFIMLDYFLLDVDNDRVPELLVQYPDSPASLNGVFDFRDGVISCWRFDLIDGSEFQYPLMDGTMVFEHHFSGAYSFRLFRYTPDGEREDMYTLSHFPAGGLFGDSEESASWEVAGQAVSEEEFDRAVEELITSRRVAGGRGIPVPDLAACRDDLLMYFLLDVADGAYAEGAQYELGERFLARPGDILSSMAEYRGVETTRWSDRGGDKADQLVWMLVSEFKVMRYGTQDADQFLAALGSFSEDDYDGMVRSVREAWDSRVLP